MARVYLHTFPEGIGPAYTVDKPVGAGGVNHRDDVLLVQFFLHAAMLPGHGTAGYNPPGERPIKVDGMCGPQTIHYIKYFQKEGKRRNPGNPTVADGRVDPLAGGSMYGGSRGGFMTILALNARYRSVKGHQMHADIRSDPDFPAQLTPSLYV